MPALRVSPTGEVFVPFSADRASVPMATHIRSTMVATSIFALKGLGVFDTYLAHLDPARRAELPATVAGFWLPMEAGIAHYEACDRLGLTVPELVAIGESVGERATKSALSLAVKLAAQSGVTPWTMLSNAPRLWDRAFQGSSIGVFKLGPKEARVEMVSWPLARIEYNRVSFRGILRSLTRPFCTEAYVHDMASLCTPTSVAYRVAWA